VTETSDWLDRQACPSSTTTMMTVAKTRTWRIPISGSTVSVPESYSSFFLPSSSPFHVIVRQKDARIQRDGELSDSDDEGMGGRRHRQNHGESSEKPSSRRNGKSPEKRDTNGGSTSPAADKKKRSNGEKADSGTPELNLEAPPAPKGTVVNTGAIVPTEELEEGEIEGDAEMKATGTETLTNQSADVDMNAVNSEIEDEKATGQIKKVGTEAKGANETGAIPPAPTAG
jgi:hypothetical protein